MRIALSDVPTWRAFLAAVVAGLIAFRAYRIEKNRDRITRERGRRGQEEKVAAWYGTKKEGGAFVGAGVQKQTAPQYAKGAYACNASEFPVYNLAVRFYLPRPERPDQPGVGIPCVANKMTLPPGDSVYFPIPNLSLVIATDNTRIHDFGRVEIDFTDAGLAAENVTIKVYLHKVREIGGGHV